jgi:AraC family transcriptional regulator
MLARTTPIAGSSSDDGRFYGTVVKRWTTEYFRFSESVYPPGAALSRHSHENPYFCILLQGSYHETYRGGIRECQPATALVHPPGEVHEDHFLSEGGRIFRFEIIENAPDLCFTRELFDLPELRNGRVRCLAARLYGESCRPDQFSLLAAEALALEIVGEAARNVSRRDSSGMPRWLVKATELLHETLPDNLTVAKIANVVGIHPVHLARVFRMRYGCSIGEYARRWRVEVASRELAATATPIAEVAASAGFADQSHLCRTLRSVSGLTPSEFRAIFRRR